MQGGQGDDAGKCVNAEVVGSRCWVERHKRSKNEVNDMGIDLRIMEVMSPSTRDY